MAIPKLLITEEQYEAIKVKAARERVTAQKLMRRAVLTLLDDTYPQGNSPAQDPSTIPPTRTATEHELDIINRIAPGSARRLREVISQLARDLGHGDEAIHNADKTATEVHRELDQIAGLQTPDNSGRDSATGSGAKNSSVG